MFFSTLIGREIQRLSRILPADTVREIWFSRFYTTYRVLSLSSKGNCVTIGVLTQEHLGELEGILQKASEQSVAGVDDWSWSRGKNTIQSCWVTDCWQSGCCWRFLQWSRTLGKVVQIIGGGTAITEGLKRFLMVMMTGGQSAWKQELLYLTKSSWSAQRMILRAQE